MRSIDIHLDNIMREDLDMSLDKPAASVVEVRLSSRARPVRKIDFTGLSADVFRIVLALRLPGRSRCDRVHPQMPFG